MAKTNETDSPVDAAAIKRLRESMGWTQKDLERQADVSMATVQRAERGDPTLKASTVKHLSDALGVPLSAVYAVQSPVRREEVQDAPVWAQEMEARIEERARRRHEELVTLLGDTLNAVRAHA